MPQYLRNDSIRLLEGALQALNLAIVGIGLPPRHTVRQPNSLFAPTIGLAGCAAELGMNACLVQAYGSTALQASANRYKTGREVLHSFRQMLRAPIPRAAFLTSGVDLAQEHRAELLRRTEAFTILMSSRAAGLHSGLAPLREACASSIRKVHAFFECLSISSRVKPYLESLPQPQETVPNLNILLDDLIGQIRSSRQNPEIGSTITSLFLVLPEVPQNPPEWISAFERLTVSPTETDIALLIRTLENALEIQLHRTTGCGTGLPVRVDPANPCAVPIAPQRLRRSLTQLADQWYADSALANGRLEADQLDLPPIDFLLDLVVLGPSGIRQHISAEDLTGHTVWPFVATSLLRQGTPGPYWFLVRLCNDLGQLKAQLERALQLSNRSGVAERLAEATEGIEILRTASALSSDSGLGTQLMKSLDETEERREQLGDAISRNRNTVRVLADEYAELVSDVALGNSRVGDALDVLLETGFSLDSAQPRRYWARTLCECALDTEDIAPIVAVLRDDDLDQAHTAARKALRLIDLVTFGPQVEPSIED